MSAERPHRENSGVLFNNRKRTSDKAPDMTGEAMVGPTPCHCPHCGHEFDAAAERYRVASWEKKAANGDTYRTLAFTLPEDESEGQQ